MGFLAGNESLRRRPRAACYIGRGFGDEKRNLPSRHQSLARAALLFWAQVSCDCFPDDCRDGPILGPVLFPAQRLIEQETASLGGKSHGDFLEVAALPEIGRAACRERVENSV